MSNNIVSEWLISLHLGQYAESFIDNGYDDLEICKQVGDPDLDAIGVLNPVHRNRVLESVRTLREEGAASVYFTLEETTAIHEECLCDDVSVKSSYTSSGLCSEKESVTSVSNNVTSSVDNVSEATKYVDEYEEGKAELIKIPRMQLRMLLREKLTQDGIQLSYQPYSQPDGERGYLEGLASRYADVFNTHYVDVLADLEDLRRKEWIEISPPKSNTFTIPATVSNSYTENPTSNTLNLTTSQSQPLYVPGKYSPSSCLSDKEEDEIYGFGYGVFGAKIARQQKLITAQPQNYQTCLSPRSAYFYEFPPNDQIYSNTTKKKTSFSKFLRGLKTSHRKERYGSCSPSHGKATLQSIPQRVDTPDSVLQSGLGVTDLSQHAVLRSMIDPRDFDRLRHMHVNGGTSNTFEETIYRLKLQEAVKKREKITKDHEEILRDIREGLLRLRNGCQGDDTYMYDEDLQVLAPSAHAHDKGHWYDEPPYESDPDDFLMGSSQRPTTATAVSSPQEPEEERAVSQIASVEDVSFPIDTQCQYPSTPTDTPTSGYILPQPGYLPTIIPLSQPRNIKK